MAAASPAGPPPITNTSVAAPERPTRSPFSLFVCSCRIKSDVCRALGQTQRLGPERRGRVRQFHYVPECCHKLVELAFAHHKRRRRLEHHEVVAADLREDILLSKHSHHDHLAKHRRMNFVEGLI